MNCNIMKTQYHLKCNFFVMEKFCDFFTLRNADLITTLTYILMDNFILAYIMYNYNVL